LARTRPGPCRPTLACRRLILPAGKARQPRGSSPQRAHGQTQRARPGAHSARQGRPHVLQSCGLPGGGAAAGPTACPCGPASCSQQAAKLAAAGSRAAAPLPPLFSSARPPLLLQVVAVLSSLAVVERASIDEAYLDVSQEAGSRLAQLGEGALPPEPADLERCHVAGMVGGGRGGGGRGACVLPPGCGAVEGSGGQWRQWGPAPSPAAGLVLDPAGGGAGRAGAWRLMRGSSSRCAAGAGTALAASSADWPGRGRCTRTLTRARASRRRRAALRRGGGGRQGSGRRRSG
jgi:hypothetical protein